MSDTPSEPEPEPEQVVAPWRQTEITLTGTRDYANPYTDVDVWAEFTHDSGTVLRRPAFWDGGRVWKIRFASPESDGRWTWLSAGSITDEGLSGQSGALVVHPAVADDADADDGGNAFHRHGFWRMSPGGRSLVHADGRPALLVGDTAWALPWRATEEQVTDYAADRFITDPANVPLPYRVVDPRTGETVREGVRATAGEPVPDEGGAPRVYICHDPDRS